MPGYVRAALHAFQHEKPKRPQDSPYPWTQPVYGKNNQMLSEKALAGELDEYNQKIIQKILVKSLYYARAIYPAMLMALNSLVAVQTKPKIETAKQITQFLNYSATHPDAITELQKNHNDSTHILWCILHIKTGGTKQSQRILFLGPNSKTPIQEMPPENGPVHVECSIIRNSMALSTVAV